MAGVVVDGVGDVATIVVVGVAMTSVVLQSASYYFWKTLVLKNKNKKIKNKKHQPRMGMAGIIVDGVGDVATVVVVRVIVARVMGSPIVGGFPVNKRLVFERGEKRK